MVAATARKPSVELEFTMDDIKHRLDGQDGAIQKIADDVGKLVKAAGSIIEVLGQEEEDGTGGYKGTGIVGRTRRNEHALKETNAKLERLRELYHRWIAFGAGFSACLGGAGLIIWYTIGDKISIILKGHP